MNLQITQMLCPPSKYDIKCPYAMDAVEIAVHNTANDASAMNEVSYMITNNFYTSFHFAVDYERAVQGIPLNRNAFHASDGEKGNGNRKTIAVEICHSKSGGDNFAKSEANASILIAHLLKERGWPISRVKRHYDYAPDKKYCPHRTMDLGWERFLNMVQTAMGGVIPKPVTPTAPNKPSTKKRHAYKIDGFTFVNGIHQVRSNYLVPVDFNWTDNGIGLGSIDFVDANGNMLANQHYDGSQKHFAFAEGKVSQVSNSIRGSGGYYWIQFHSAETGMFWLSCDNLNDLYYRAYDQGQ